MTDSNEAVPFWDATDHVRAAMAEALAAERLHSNADIAEEVRWLGGHNAAVDITAVIDGKAVRADAKRAFMHRRHPGRLTWMGRTGNAIPETTTHLALVLLNEDDTAVRVAQSHSDPADLRVAGLVRGAVYLVPRDVALTATPALKLDGTVGAGLNVGLPLAVVQPFLLAQGSSQTPTAA